MASVKVKFHQPAVEGEPGRVYYLLTHRNLSRRIPSAHRLYPSEWNNRRSTIIAEKRNGRLETLYIIRRHIRCDLERIRHIIHTFEIGGSDFSVEEILQEFNQYIRRYTLFNFMQTLINRLQENGRVRTAETYTTTLHSFRKFREGIDIRFDYLTSDIIEAFAAWHKKQGHCPNTVSFYNRILRAVYNRAMEEAAFEDAHPFRHVYTGVEKTKKRALPIMVIKRIKNLDLASAPLLDYARDIFILSFMLRGMSFVDMTFLKKSDLCRGVISYRRRKTGQKLVIAWTHDMQRILDKYPENESDYLFPIIRRRDMNERAAYRNLSYSINRSLKNIAIQLGLPEPLTLYVARHSWANAAREKGVPLNVISEGMGHDREQTTRIYLNSLDTATIDKANSLIITSLR